MHRLLIYISCVIHVLSNSCTVFISQDTAGGGTELFFPESESDFDLSKFNWDSDYGSASGIESAGPSCMAARSESQNGLLAAADIPPPPFTTPEKLLPVEYVLREFPSTNTASLRLLAVSLARDAIFGREEMAKRSQSGRKKPGLNGPLDP